MLVSSVLMVDQTAGHEPPEEEPPEGCDGGPCWPGGPPNRLSRGMEGRRRSCAKEEMSCKLKALAPATVASSAMDWERCMMAVLGDETRNKEMNKDKVVSVE